MLDDHDPPAVAFTDITALVDCLEHIPLRSPALAETQLLRVLDSLLLAPPAPELLFSLLEQMRAPLCFVEEQIGRQYHNKPLPLAEEEEMVWRRAAAAWRKMSEAYQLCLTGVRLDGTTEDEGRGLSLATVLHRCLYYTGQYVVEHYRVRRELPEGVWLELHNLYRMAEVQRVTAEPVDDSLENDGQTTDCAVAYSALLLIDIANPYTHTLHNLTLIQRWASLWAPLVSLAPVTGELPRYCVELDKDLSLHSSEGTAAGGELRQMDCHRLGEQIELVLGELYKRVTPSQLGLGEETSSHVIRLLGTLRRPWTQSTWPRRFRRFDSQGLAKVVAGFPNMHFFVTGSEFAQPDSAATYSRGDFDRLFTFREQSEPGQELTIKPHAAFLLDEWAVSNHSATGFQLRRGAAGERLTFGQLMAVLPHDGDRYLLAQTTWLMEDRSGGLIAGVHIMPGLPVGIGVRLSHDGGPNTERYCEAFLLPPVPSIHEEGSLVLPAGLYQASRVLDVVWGEETWAVRMNHVLQRGSDFDRVSYQTL